MAPERRSSQWKSISVGRKRQTAVMLKKSWMVAAAKARRNSRRWPMCPRLTRVLVTEVPMFAPITIGMATWMGSPPTHSPTITDVVTELLWMMAVTSSPATSPTKGLPA